MTCHDHVHDQTITETRLRTFLKNATGNIIEVLIDFFLLDAAWSALFGQSFTAIFGSLGMSIVIEGVCFTVSYLTDRAWNRISWGRHIYCKQCKNQEKKMKRNGKIRKDKKL